MSKTALEAAIQRAGGQSALARALGVKQPVVANWLARQVPAGRVLSIETATGVPRTELRPDIYPPDRLGSPESGDGGPN